MKTLFFNISLFFIIINGFSQDVQIPNNNFENWKNNTFYEEPTGYTTSNYYLYKKLNVVTVTKTTDKYQGNYALKLQTVATETQDTIAGSADYITIFQGEKSVTGFPFVEKPTAFKGHLKYNTSNNDSVLIYFGFKKNGREIYYKEYKLYGHQTSYKDVIVNIENFEETPDTAFVGFSSATSLPFAKKNKAMGANNFLVIDDISFVGAATPIPNGDFEDWTAFGREKVEDWQDLNSYIPLYENTYCSKTNTKHSGSFAMSIKTVEVFINDEPKYISYITTGEFISDNLKASKPIAKGGFAIQNNPDSIGFWYKYNNEFNEQDRALVIVNFTKYFNNSLWDMGRQVFELEPTDIYKYKNFKLNIGNPNLPANQQKADTANIILSSSNYPGIQDYIGIGNELVIDDMNFIYKGTQPDKFKISGVVNYDNKDKTVMKDVKLVLKNKEGLEIGSTLTDAEGKYVFEKLDTGKYTITAGTTKAWRKTTPVEALFINRTFIGIYKIESEFKKRAADVDGNKSVTPIDALFVNRRFLGMVKSFKISDWLFDIPAVINLDKDMVINIKALCAGDLRGDYKP